MTFFTPWRLQVYGFKSPQAHWYVIWNRGTGSKGIIWKPLANHAWMSKKCMSECVGESQAGSVWRYISIQLFFFILFYIILTHDWVGKAGLSIKKRCNKSCREQIFLFIDVAVPPSPSVTEGEAVATGHYIISPHQKCPQNQ